jgi:hypothetical protein
VPRRAEQAIRRLSGLKMVAPIESYRGPLVPSTTRAAPSRVVVDVHQPPTIRAPS